MANDTVYGFIGLEDLFSRRVSDVDSEVIYTAVEDTLAEYNRIVGALMANFVERTTKVQMLFAQPGAGTMQPLDDFGNPLPVQPGPQYQVGFPIRGAGTAWGDNRVTRAHMTVGEVNESLSDALRRDRDWLMRHMMSAILDGESWVFVDKAYGSYKGAGDINIMPLANGDTTVYAKRGGILSTDDHYMWQSADIADATNPFPAIKANLIEHAGNSGPLVAYAASNLIDDIAGLDEFVEVADPDISYGSGESTVGAQASVLGPGVEVIGKTKSSNCWVAEWPNLPDNYMIAAMLGTAPGMRMREYVPAELHGLFTEYNTPDGNIQENRYIRYTGFGMADRTSMVAYLVDSGESDYVTPPAFDAPLPI